MKFLIFTKYRCSFCDRAKTLIEQKGYEYESINIEEDNNIELLLKKVKEVDLVGTDTFSSIHSGVINGIAN